MIENDYTQRFEEVIQNAESVLIVYPSSPSVDIAAAAVALYLNLTDQGRRVSIASPEMPTGAPGELEAINKTVTEIGNQNLVISFDYDEAAVDKVSYHIGEDNQKFYLTIKPKVGTPPLDASNVDFTYTGVESDVLILVGVKSLPNLEQLYYGYEEVYEQAQLISLNSNSGRTGVIEINSENGESLSERVAELLANSPYGVSDVAATNLLRGIEQVTQHFSSLSTTADTFETVARLMRAGARRSRPQRLEPIAELKGELPRREDSSKPKNIDVKAKESKKNEGRKPGSLKYTPGEDSPRGG